MDIRNILPFLSQKKPVVDSVEEEVVSSKNETEREFKNDNDAIERIPENSSKRQSETKAGDVSDSSAGVETGEFDKYSEKKSKFSPVIIIAPLLLIVLGGLVYLGLRFVGQDGIISTKRGELTWWGLGIEEDIMKPLIEEYQEIHPNVKIIYINQSPQDYRERLRNTMVQEKAPDIFRFHNSWVPMFLSDLDTLPSGVMTVEEYAKTFYPVIVSDMSSGSGFLGIPLEYDALTLYVNEDIFAQAARTPPTTWDDFLELAITLTQKEQQRIIIQSGASLGITDNVDHWPEILALMMIQNGVDLSNPTGKLAVDAVTYYSSFSFQEKIWDNTLPPSTVSFSQGKVAMYIAPTWRADEIRQLNPSLRFRTVPIPQIRKNVPNAPNITYAIYWAEGVWNKSPNKDLAWDFLKFLSQKESLEKLNRGMEEKGSFGMVYPRVDMNEIQANDSIFGSVVTLAPDAKSWFLASNTYDGETGINSQLSELFKEVVAIANTRNRQVEAALNTAAKGISNILSQYQAR